MVHFWLVQAVCPTKFLSMPSKLLYNKKLAATTIRKG
ncbi:hypothetical protein F441_21846 [Phytophthora nicotianae CJ01A1]|uniref:Uncharacterized protein n=3 Tax=Phytophthora nicotianae TaxID=4792 RepID=W2PGZ7_PHYN3|nr:hypothetical protein PPTG_24399 [Phytophthora nicotianae INRA-310]ETK71392.1 hypothetical protein L915_21357 [Phytophthora nicotianae]ETP00806.1 hypothetical protein F441_21846 [Phytophthora nicotianae CJ01A1]ETL24832.1 hypothetical protein L916_21228 [Phytophthora nicotianae]ETL78048.1 hypothetical protein L917_21082 [Phytophthora nicotianae]ETM31318.1 hypothetical protein L914_21091 [Phytophthora nicotianae]